jgi:hypothetical protein
MPMTTGTLMAVMGGIFAVSGFFIGRRFATMTPEKAAEMERKNGGKPVDLNGLRLIGKVQMISAPVIGAVLAYMGLTGMAG